MFGKFGLWLRGLSLSGGAGNLAAWAVVLVLTALPLAGLLALWLRRKRLYPRDGLLVLLSGLLFLFCWFGANPTLLGSGSGQFFPMASAGAAVSVLVAWFALDVLRGLEAAPADRLAAALKPLLLGCAALLALAAVYGCVSGLLRDWEAVKSGNTVTGDLPIAANSPDLGPTLAVMAAVAVLRLAPDLLAALTLVWGARLAGRLGALDFGEDTLALCGQTARSCKGVAQATVVLAVAANVLQLAALGALYSSHFRVDFPIFPLVLSTALYLLCRCLQRGKELQDDSASII